MSLLSNSGRVVGAAIGDIWASPGAPSRWQRRGEGSCREDEKVAAEKTRRLLQRRQEGCYKGDKKVAAEETRRLSLKEYI